MKDKSYKERFAWKGIVEVKEVDGELIVKGYIATTHFDGQDTLLKETLDLWAKEINEGIPRANKVSVNHKRNPHVAGVGLKGSAKVRQLPDGEWGLYVETKIDQTREDYVEIKYRIENDFLDSFSIEYYTPQDNYSGEPRILGVDTELYGWTLASQPMNENAVMIKEILQGEESIDLKRVEEHNKMVEEENVVAPVEEVVEAPTEEVVVEEAVPEVEAEPVIEEPVAEEPVVEEAVVEEKEMIKKVTESVMKKVKQMSIKEKVLQPKAEVKEIPLEVKEYKEIFDKSANISIKEQFVRASNIAIKEDLWNKPTSRAESRDFKHFGTNGNKLEYKALGITTNSTDYTQSAAELQDVYDPIIINALNQETVFWNILAKDDFSSKGNNQVQFVMKTAANTTATFYDGNAVTTANGTRTKNQTKFKKVQVGVSIDGDMIAAARGGPMGDIFATEVQEATMDMLAVINSALFAEVGLETATAVIGLEYITDSSGNGTLYGVSRTSANKLAPASNTDTYINQASAVISMTNLRQGIRYCVTDGSKKKDLIYVTSPTQADMYKSKFDDARRFASDKETRFGFSTALFVDGVPIFEDKDVNTDDWFCVDMAMHRAAIWVPPTIEMLGHLDDSQGAFIKMYFAIYNRAPRRMVQIYGCSTS